MNQHLEMVASGIERDLWHMVSSGVTPGLQYALVSGADVLVRRAGDRQIYPVRAPLPPDVFYDLASLTKVVGTTPLLLTAMAAGDLRLTDALQTYLPDFPDASVTFQALMTHTAGLEGYIPHRDELSARDLQTALTTQLHVGPSRGRAVYRDYNLLLVGWALERLYGEPVQQLITTRVLKPWGLTADVTFAPAPNRCVPTTYDAVNGLRQGRVHDPKADRLGDHAASAGLFGTLNGLVRYVQLACSVVPQTVLPTGWANTLQHDVAGGRTIGFDLRRGPITGRQWLYHTGYTGTFMAIDPVSQQGLIVLASRCHPTVHKDFLRQRDNMLQKFVRLAETGENPR